MRICINTILVLPCYFNVIYLTKFGQRMIQFCRFKLYYLSHLHIKNKTHLRICARPTVYGKINFYCSKNCFGHKSYKLYVRLQIHIILFNTLYCNYLYTSIFQVISIYIFSNSLYSKSHQLCHTIVGYNLF